MPRDKTLHLAAYGILGALAALAYKTTSAPRPAGGKICFALAAFAFFDEMTQPIFGRAAEPLDFVADVVGILTGWAFTWHAAMLVHQWRKGHATTSN